VLVKDNAQAAAELAGGSSGGLGTAFVKNGVHPVPVEHSQQKSLTSEPVVLE